MKIRNDLDYRNEILRGKEPYEKGLELALLLAYHGVKQDDVRKSGTNAKNSLRKGFPEFLKNEKTGRKIIFSAGVKDWLMNFYMQNFSNNNFDVAGTSLYVNENGEYTGIKKSCGRESKRKRIIELSSGVGNNVIKIGVGDSDGDRDMFDYILENDGITVGIGDGIDGIINLPEDIDWHSVVDEVKKYSEEKLYVH